jgi:hypothetical protein
VDPITLILIIVAIGVLLWVIKAYVPMDPAITRLLTVAAVVVVVVLLVSFLLGVLDVGQVRVGG